MSLHPYFHRIDSLTFQDFCISLLYELNNIDIVPGGRGADGGRDAVFNGALYMDEGIPKLSGKWLIQIKHHNIDTLGKTQWHQTTLADLKSELHKFLKRKMEFDSYLFITNVPLTWIFKNGTYDKIAQDIDPLIREAGLKNFRIFDGNKLKTLLPQVPLTDKYFNPNREENMKLNQKKISWSMINSISSNLKFVLRDLNNKGIIKLHPPRKNPHFLGEVFWEHSLTHQKYYLIHLTSRRELNNVLTAYRRLFSNEVLCIFGVEILITQLSTRVRFLPLNIKYTQEELNERISSPRDYIIGELK